MKLFFMDVKITISVLASILILGVITTTSVVPAYGEHLIFIKGVGNADNCFSAPRCQISVQINDANPSSVTGVVTYSELSDSGPSFVLEKNVTDVKILGNVVKIIIAGCDPDTGGADCFILTGDMSDGSIFFGGGIAGITYFDGTGIVKNIGH